MAQDEITFSKLMQAKGLRVTEQRLLILDAICEGRGHTTLAEILVRLKSYDAAIDPSTVYRTLDLFVKLGLINANVTGDGISVYEIAGEDAHHHMHCVACGLDIEISHEEIAPLFEALHSQYGFTVTARHVIMEGLCDTCREQADSTQNP